MNGRIFFWSLTSALAGFLFGFDTVVISGAEKTIQTLWGLSPGLHGIAMASALYGTVIGALLGAWPADRFGRKATLLWIGILYLVGAIGSGLAPNVTVFIIARVIGGLGIGISTVVAPMYISEIAPPKHRGLLAGMFQFNIVFGILVAYVSNALLAGIGDNAWRWMLGVAAFPSLIYAAFCLACPKVRGGCLAARAIASLLSRYCNASSLRLRARRLRPRLMRLRLRQQRNKNRPPDISGRSGFGNQSCWLF